MNRLTAIQAQLKALKKREAELEARILTGECGLIGEDYVAIPNEAGDKIIDVVKLPRSSKEN
jgi:hypothetical protein